MSSNNSPTESVQGATSNASPAQQYYDLYEQVTVSDPQMLKNAIENSKTGTIAPFLMITSLNRIAQLYGVQLQTSQVFVTDAAQQLSDAWADILQDLQTIQQMGIDGKSGTDFENITQSLMDKFQKLQDTMNQLYADAKDNLPDIPDGAGGWKENPCLDDFNSMMGKSEDNISAFYSSFNGVSGGSGTPDYVYSYGYYLSDTNDSYKAVDATSHFAALYKADLDGDLPSGITDYLSQLVKGNMDLVYNSDGSAATGSSSGADPYATTYLPSLMTRYTQAVQLYTGDINNIYDIIRPIVDGAAKEQGTDIQNQLVR